MRELSSPQTLTDSTKDPKGLRLDKLIQYYTQIRLTTLNMQGHNILVT